MASCPKQTSFLYLHTRDIDPVSISSYKCRNKFKLLPKEHHDKE